MRPTNLFHTLDSQSEQENEDDAELKEPLDETPVVAEEDNNVTQIKPEMSKFKIPQVEDDNSMRKMARALSKEQRMVFDRTIDYLTKVTCSGYYIRWCKLWQPCIR